MLVLDKVEYDFSKPGRDEVGGVAKEDVAFSLRTDLRGQIFLRLVLGNGLVRQPPFALCIAQTDVS